ncbi:MAG: TIGR04282 family arsenosugar biosynthesis glycosyltransferase [Pseudomonadota bacterium]
MTRGTLIIMAKAPRAGAVKTRLGRDIGMGRAAALFRILSERTIEEARRGDWRTIIAVSPTNAAIDGWGALWPAGVARIPQGASDFTAGDLGERMSRAMRAAPAGPIVVIGADAPGMRARHIRTAFSTLNGADAVFGPANDGGYWLIGLARRRTAPALFYGVRWSSPHALADTVESLPAGFSVKYLPTLGDVDTAADLASIGLRSTRGGA